jgi:hypothetical protein
MFKAFTGFCVRVVAYRFLLTAFCGFESKTGKSQQAHLPEIYLCGFTGNGYNAAMNYL